MYYARIVEAAKALPGGMNQFLGEIADPRVRAFVQQRFQFMTWYDALPTLPCQVALSRLLGGPFEEHIRERARLSMEKLIPSMFRLLSKLGGPRAAASHSSRLIQTYFDFVDLRLDKVTDTGGTGTMSGIPMYLAPVTINVILGVLVGALQSLGAKDIHADYRDVEVTGTTGTFHTVSCTSDIRWKLTAL
jgi:hypothetical protein